MKSESHPRTLPPGVAAQLKRVRRRVRRLGAAEGLLRAAAGGLGAVLAALATDLAFGWVSPLPRYVATGLAAAIVLVGLLRWFVPGLFQRDSLVEAARDVDQSLPGSEERWATLTELEQSSDRPEVRGSETLIRQVGLEAEAAGAKLEVRDVVSVRAVRNAAGWCLGALAALAAFVVLNAASSSVLWERLLHPGRDVSLTRIRATPSDVWVPRGESITLSAALEGRTPRNPAVLMVRGSDGRERTANMIQTASGQCRHVVEEVSDSFEYRVQAGDGRTPWHKITAADRPRITEVRLKVTPPAYSRQPVEEKAALPGTVRLLEGSELDLAFRSDQPLDRFWLDMGEGKSLPLQAGEGQWYRFRSVPTNSFELTAHSVNRFRLENRVKPSTRVSVYEDRAPSVALLEPSDDVAVAPGEKVDVVFEATDDLGIARAEIQVETVTVAGVTNSMTIPVELGADAGKPNVKKTVQLDPAALGLKQGDQLSYVVQVTDTKQSPGRASSEESERRDGLASKSGKKSSEKDGDATSAKPASKDGEAASKESGPQTASNDRKASDEEAAASEASKAGKKPDDDAQSQAQASAPEASSKPGENSDAKGSKNSSMAKASNAKPSEPSKGSQPPPDDMTRRSLDVGQCAACKKRNIMVDEWAGKFDGERRKKLELEIAPVLQELDAHLARAQASTGKLRERAEAKVGLTPTDSGDKGAADGALGAATETIGKLRGRTYGTPYAFIGLQLYAIGDAHVTPARASLGQVVLSPSSEAAATNGPALERTAFHIARAREKLADLTRTFETVKRDQQVADAMQRLAKMYQIFLEDTQAMLGNGKGPINSFDRKIAEVDEAFVEKLKALLEEKKKIMAELAKTLGDDPRLLRRYLAMMQLQATSYRDQLTLLAEREKVVQTQLHDWTRTPEAERAGWMKRLGEHYAGAHKTVVGSATQLRENLETWLPLDVKTDEPRVKDALARAEKVVLLTAESAGTGPEGKAAGQKSLEALRELRERLPELGSLPTTNRAKLDAYVANRLPEIEALVTAQSGRLKMLESLETGDFAKVAEIVQYAVTSDTVTLEGKLDTTETQVASMSPEIARKAADLLKIFRLELIEPEKASVESLARREVPQAEKTVDAIVPAFERAERTFDELMRLIIAKMDEAPPPTDPGSAQGLESLLAMLQDEMKAAESLGIPCRPMNVSIMRDWMKPGSGQGQGQGQGQGRGQGQAKAQAQAARSQAESGKAESERLEKKARESARQALAQAKAAPGEEETTAGDSGARREDWNKLASRLRKDLMQGRDAAPPEQYRDAIANYFKTLAGQPTADRGSGNGK